MGYRYIAALQAVLTLVLVCSLPLWKKRPAVSDGSSSGAPLALRQIPSIPGAVEMVTVFFCYCALEQTAGLWASSFLVLHWGVGEEAAAAFACLFYLGVTLGRFVSGFLTMKLSDPRMIRLGEAGIAVGCVLLALPWPVAALCGFALVGLGCAPIYPCAIHATPAHFGEERSQALLGVQIAGAYVGACAAPAAFGLLANRGGIGLLPVYLGAILVLMAAMYQRLLKKAPAAE